MEMEEPRPAPEGLRLVQEFVNTRSNLRDVDALDDVTGTSEWLESVGFGAEATSGIGEAERRALISFREGLRVVLAGHNDRIPDGDDAAALREFDSIAVDGLLRVGFEEDGEVRLLPAEEAGVGAVISSILAAVADAAIGGTWRRLKACRNDECRWAFYDGSRNRTGTWCDMDTCGARHKMRAYRARRSD